MGQAQAAPKADDNVQHFVNLPKEAIESLWTSYNLNCEGWSLNIDDFNAIFNGAPFIKDNYKFNAVQLKAMFSAFDTDDNGLIDAIEMFIGIALISGISFSLFVYFFICKFVLSSLRYVFSRIALSSIYPDRHGYD